MNERGKIRVGITQGDINGIGYEIIFKTFENPEMFDICTPIVFGSPKAAAYHRKALEMEITYNAIEKVSEAQTGKLNIVNCNDDELQHDLKGLIVRIAFDKLGDGRRKQKQIHKIGIDVGCRKSK